MFALTDEQQRAFDRALQILRGRGRRFKIGGLAGTGKSVLVAALVEAYRSEYGDDIAVCTPTGKAAHVLRSKGVDIAMTLHPLLYTPRNNRRGDVEFRFKWGEEFPRCVVVDEASMLNVTLVRDLERAVKHVVYVGDHGQLEPIGDDPGLMSSLDVRLETIHRQARGSPIIRFAHHVRKGHAPQTFREDTIHRGKWTRDLKDFDVILVGFNRTRMKVNKWMRRERGFSGHLPQPGETVICLRNSKDYCVWNGMTATVKAIDTERNLLTLNTDDGPRNRVPFDPAQFGAERTLPYERPRKGQPPPPTLWDFGYALTVHKAQGSQWPRVAVVEELHPDWSADRWRYTGATRPSEKLRWVYK